MRFSETRQHAAPGPDQPLSAVRRLLPYMKPYRIIVILGFICLAGQIASELAAPLIWKYVIDHYIKSGVPSQLIIPVVLLVLSYAVTAGLGGVRTYMLTKASQGFIYDLRVAIYRSMQQQPLSYFQDRRTGDLLARVVSDVDTVQEALVSGADRVLASLLRVIGVGAAFIALQPALGVFTISPWLFVAVALYFYNRRIKGIYKEIRSELGQVSAKLQDNLSGIAVIKSFAREDYEIAEFSEAARNYYQVNVDGIAIRSRFFPFVRFIAYLGQVIMLGLGAYMIWRGQFTIGGLVAYRGYGRYFYGPIDELMGINDMLQRAGAGSDRIFEALDAVPAILDKAEAVELQQVRGDVDFHNVVFGYREGLTILNDINLHVPAGRMVGIFGPSGIGKTTLMNLIARFYDPDSGSVCVDGHDLRDVSQQSLRRNIGIVQQETFLFNASVIDNIRYGRLDATDEDIYQASREASAHEFILGLPEGYDTLIGERGTKLSGGQRQRLAIARCFLSNPRILLMDEPTSAVEPESERAIIESLQSLAEGRTTFVISHRLSLLKSADLIISVADGRIVQSGTHEELIAAGGSYAEAWKVIGSLN